MKPYYQDEFATIYHGDCRHVLEELPGGICDLTLTDPPYGVTYQSNHRVGQGSTPITNDGARLSLRLYREVAPLLDSRHVLWFTRWDVWPDVWGILGHHYSLRGLLVWDKGHNGMGDLGHWGMSYELIASLGIGNTQGGRDGSILRYAPVPAGARSHPTEKPIALLAYLIGKLGAETVLDPFMGTGATLVAAKTLGRKVIGVEMKEAYCEIAAQRLAQALLPFPEEEIA